MPRSPLPLPSSTTFLGLKLVRSLARYLPTLDGHVQGQENDFALATQRRG
jgi:hypothetical protein